MVGQAGVIRTAFNYGETKLGPYYVDGYLEYEDDWLYKIAFEYMGCHYHRCPDPGCKIPCRQTDEEARRDSRRLAAIELEVNQLNVMRSCQWKILEKNIGNIQPEISKFLFQTNITETNILDAIEAGEFFGMIKADIVTPDEVIKKFEQLNFPLLFRDVEVTEDMVNPELLAKASARKKKFPSVYKTLCWNGTDMVLATPLLQFYLRLGMQVKNVKWAIQHYERNLRLKLENFHTLILTSELDLLLTFQVNLLHHL